MRCTCAVYVYCVCGSQKKSPPQPPHTIIRDQLESDYTSFLQSDRKKVAILQLHYRSTYPTMSRFNLEAVTQGPEYQKTQDYRRQEFDSGFGDLSSIQTTAAAATTPYTSIPPGPTPPNLIVDVENGDSGITLDDAETDCVATVQHHRRQQQQRRQQQHHQRKLAPAGVVPMEVDETPKLISRGSGSSSPVSYQRAKKSAAPRLPKKTLHSSTSASSTVSAPHRSASPKSVYTSELHTSTSISPSPAAVLPGAVPYNKENQGPSSLPFMRSGSPLTCNNSQSLNLPERVPPIGQGMSSDVFQLRDYLNFFLPDTKEGDT